MPAVRDSWKTTKYRPRCDGKNMEATTAGTGASPAEAARPDTIRDTSRLLNDFASTLQMFDTTKRRIAARYMGRMPITRDRGTQRRFPKPKSNTFRQVVYPALVFDTWNSFMIGIVAIVRLLAFRLAMRVKAHMVKYVLSLSLRGQPCVDNFRTSSVQGSSPYQRIVDTIIQTCCIFARRLVDDRRLSPRLHGFKIFFDRLHCNHI